MKTGYSVLNYVTSVYIGLKRRITNHLVISQLSKCQNILLGNGVKFHGYTVIKVDSESTICIGKNFTCRSGSRYGVGTKNSKIQLSKGARLYIGDNSGMSNSNIACTEEIIIGDNVNIGFETTIMDSDFHSISITDRKTHKDVANAKSKRVIIHDNVFIGAHCLILKGVEIGENSVIAAGSVVATDIPANQLWGGYLAKKIKDL